MGKDDVSGLKSLGSGKTDYPNDSGVNPELLEKFPNKFPGRSYVCNFETSEFTSLCPVTNQPDFGKITISYSPDEWCIESKGLKLYLFSFRTEGAFMETIVGTITEDLVNLVKPKKLTVIGDFAPRGGIGLRVESTYVRDKGVIVESKPTQNC